MVVWVRRRGDDARRRMVRGLLAGNVASGSGAGGSSAASEDPGADHEDDLDALVRSMYAAEANPPAWLEAATLAITAEELAFIEGLATLLGTTPRSVKRFVNVFQLVKTIAQAHGPVGRMSLERLLFLLAVSTGPPDTARELFTAIDAANADVTLGSVVAALTHPGSIEVWLIDHAAWRMLHVCHLSAAMRS